MTNETPVNSIYEFHDELIALLVRYDLHKPDVAAALVSAAVGLAALDGCDPELQRASIEKFAAYAIVKLLLRGDSAEIFH